MQNSHARPRDTPLRRSLRASIVEGGVSETWGVLASGSMLTAWGFFLGANATELAALHGLTMGAHVLHGPSGLLTEWVGRKRLAVLALTSARLAWLPMALSPLFGMDAASRLRLLLFVTACSAALQVVGQNAWSAWMGDVVPSSLRGRFFGARSVRVMFGASAASLLSASVLESAWPRALTLPAIAGLVCVSGVVSCVLLARQLAPAVPRARPSLGGYLEALRDPRARGLLVYQLAWGIAVAPGAAFFSVHVLGTLHAGFFVLAAHTLGIALMRALCSPAWGRVVDRVGARPVLVLCSAGVSVMPLLWCITSPANLWPLVLDSMISGCVWGGHGIAAFQLPLGIATPARRPYYLALFAMAAGIGFSMSTLLAGQLASALGGPGADLTPLFLASALGRFSCAWLALGVHDGRSAGADRTPWAWLSRRASPPSERRAAHA